MPLASAGRLLGVAPRSLSYGQKRLLAIACAIVHGPEYLFLDEPAAGLDSRGRKRIVELINRLHGDGMTIVVATHDPARLLDSCSRLIALEDGRIVVDGPPTFASARRAGIRSETMELVEQLKSRGMNSPGDVLAGNAGRQHCGGTQMKVPAEIKLAGLALFSIATLMADGWPLVALAVILVMAVPLLGANVGKLLRMFRPALLFILVIAAFQWLFSGPSVAALSSARISLLYIAGSIVTVTTTETEFITTIERLLSPISKLTGTNIGRDIATMMTLAIAFLPIIKDEHDTIRLAQEARGVKYTGLSRAGKRRDCGACPADLRALGQGRPDRRGDGSTVLRV